MSTKINAKPGYDPGMDRIEKALEFIEANLTADITVADVADAACLSLFHFARTFRARTGWTVMAYVQARRLTEAAERLRKPTPRLIDLALEYGFESQATFTRAFKRKFHKTPGALRRQNEWGWLTHCTLPFDLELKLPTGAFDMPTPRFTDLPAFKAAGLKGSFDESNRHEIGDLWDRANNIASDIPGAIAGAGYGICLPPQEADGAFDYYAAIAVEGGHDMPDGVEMVDIPAQHYAVFTHRINSAKITADILPTVRYIWEEWLPNSGYEYSGGPDFEYYDDRFKIDDNGDASGEFDIYIPVRKI